MKTIASIWLALILTVVLAVAVHGQDQTAALHFRLTVAGASCPNATYWGSFGPPHTDAVTSVQLTDPDGDGIYTGTGTTLLRPTGETRLVVQLIEGTGVGNVAMPGADHFIPGPGMPRYVIKDFGVQHDDVPWITVPHVIVTDGMVFEASIVGCSPGAAPATSVQDGVPGTLPDTGVKQESMVLLLPIAVLLLVLGLGRIRRRLTA